MDNGAIIDLERPRGQKAFSSSPFQAFLCDKKQGEHPSLTIDRRFEARTDVIVKFWRRFTTNGATGTQQAKQKQIHVTHI